MYINLSAFVLSLSIPRENVLKVTYLTQEAIIGCASPTQVRNIADGQAQLLRDSVRYKEILGDLDTRAVVRPAGYHLRWVVLKVYKLILIK